ncbi:uncharacterized protein LOC113420136 [Notechis scutatus]|uniref:Uncharacterized protein LOC113420136 n=1 Tax=Notechis scutatus TaxID=8663 RepID=A0A6J1UXM1_9SAUR|nr:uncharacterized protein LOC113420136 [Notechis scutatus]
MDSGDRNGPKTGCRGQKWGRGGGNRRSNIRKEYEKLEKEQGLKEELERMWKVKAKVVETLGAMIPKLGKWFQQIPGTTSELSVKKRSGLRTDQKLVLNTNKTKELIVDYKRNRLDIQPLLINGDQVEKVASFKFLGPTLKEDLTWGPHIAALAKRAQQRLYCPRLLRKQQLNEKLLVTFYRCTIESTLTYCTSVWFANCTVADRTALQRVNVIAQKIIGCPLPSLEELYSSRCLKKVQNILKDPSHPGNPFFKYYHLTDGTG